MVNFVATIRPMRLKEMQELRRLPNNLFFCYKNYSVFYVIIFQKIRKQEAKEMKYNLPERVIKDISKFAKKYSIEKVILFGSRARGTNTERSDIDIAVYGGDFDPFYWDIKEKVHSLLMFDVVEVDAGISEELKKEIEKDGVVIYEKA